MYQSGNVSKLVMDSTGLSNANWAAFDSLVEHNTDTAKPRAYLNYMLFDRNMRLVSGASGAYQVNGKGDWNVTGTNGIPVKIPEDGFIFIFINNHSKKPVWFDKVQVLFHRGKLKEEDHYYPYGLPMANIGSTAAGMMPNRRKYQGNEFITEAGLNWMSFGARQYDPQTGRFLSIDPLAGAGGQDRFSPYAAMGDQPAANVDPNGTNFQIPYLTTRSAGGMPDETSEAMTWNLNHMKKSLAGANFGWGNDTWDELYWGGGGGSGGQADMEWNMLSELFDAISGIGAPGGASSGYACNFANGIGSPGGDGPDNEIGEVTILGKAKGWFGRAWDWIKHTANDAAEETVSGVVLAGSGIIMPLINQTHVIYKEGIHSGGAIHLEDNVSWAVPYKIKNWKLVPKESMMTSEGMDWNDGKELIEATTGDLMLITPFEPTIEIPGAPEWINKAAEFGAGEGAKKLLEKGIQQALDQNDVYQ